MVNSGKIMNIKEHIFLMLNSRRVYKPKILIQIKNNYDHINIFKYADLIMNCPNFYHCEIILIFD